MRTKKTIIAVMVCVAMILLNGCALANYLEKSNSAKSEMERKEAEKQQELEQMSENESVSDQTDAQGDANGTFLSQDFDGNEIDQSIFSKADVTVVNIWATYCGPCLEELPDLANFANDYEDDGVQVVGICVDVYDEDSLAYAQELAISSGVKYTNLVVNDSLNEWYVKNVQYVPTTIVVDSEGNILSENVGGMGYEEFAGLVE